MEINPTSLTMYTNMTSCSKSSPTQSIVVTSKDIQNPAKTDENENLNITSEKFRSYYENPAETDENENLNITSEKFRSYYENPAETDIDIYA